MSTRLRRYRRALVGPERVMGWCESCGFLAQARPGQDEALVDRLARHRRSAHAPAETQAEVDDRALVPA